MAGQRRPQYTPVEADGTHEEVSASLYYNAISVKVLNARSIEESKKRNGRTLATSTMKVSPHRNTATCEFTDTGDSSADPLGGKAIMTGGVQVDYRIGNFRFVVP
ncbi:MAG TPA: hypothetical protein VHU83_11675 [Bryobacteraceae bacterium]|jgi:hypothetical protein|nr:hypothetical protein [Bryobacteraceae bacterium]